MNFPISETSDQTLSKIVIFSTQCFLQVIMNKKILKTVVNKNLIIPILPISVIPSGIDIGIGSMDTVIFLLFAKVDRKSELGFYLFLIFDLYRSTNSQCSDKNFLVRGFRRRISQAPYVRLYEYLLFIL